MHTKWSNIAHFGDLQARDFMQGSTKRLPVSAGGIQDFYCKWEALDSRAVCGNL